MPEELKKDANPATTSSTVADANGQDSSTAQQDVNTQQDDSTQQVDDTSADTADSSDASTGDNADDQQNGQQNDAGQQSAQVDDAATAVLDKPEDAALPFHKHPRWAEVVQEKNKWKQDYETSKPLVEQATVINNILSENNIPVQEFSNALQYLIALRKDPVAARAMLAPTFEKLSQFTGDRLPADLEAKVGAGIMTKEDAVEMARFRGQQEYQQWQRQGQQQTTQTQQQSVIESTVQTMVTLKQRLDPDFKPGTDLFSYAETLVKGMPLFRTAQEAQAGVEKAYADAKAFFAKNAPRTAPLAQKRPPQTKNTANNGGGVIKTPQDVVRAIQAGQKPHQMRYA